MDNSRISVALDKELWEQTLSFQTDDGWDRAARLEPTDIVIETISKMRLASRNVLSLRCFDEMFYAEIAVFANPRNKCHNQSLLRAVREVFLYPRKSRCIYIPSELQNYTETIEIQV